jgi:hypothetical protein
MEERNKALKDRISNLENMLKSSVGFSPTSLMESNFNSNIDYDSR